MDADTVRAHSQAPVVHRMKDVSFVEPPRTGGPPLQAKRKKRPFINKKKALFHGSLDEFNAGGPEIARVRAVRKAQQAVPGLQYRNVMEQSAAFLSPDHPVRSVDQPNGPQFIQEFETPTHEETRRVGADVVKGNPHVDKLKPHLNLQTQHDGAIQGGALADPHHAVASAEPFPAQHPLSGITPDERREFMERYLTSSGLKVARDENRPEAQPETVAEEDDGPGAFGLFD